MTKKQHSVKEFFDEEDMVLQKVYYDSSGPEKWIVVMHKGEELSMSLENWKALVKMTDQLIN